MINNKKIEVVNCVCCPFLHWNAENHEDGPYCRLKYNHFDWGMTEDIPRVPPQWCELRNGDIVVLKKF